MPELIALQDYVNEVTGLSLHRVRCDSTPMPLHIRHAFEFVCVRLEQVEYVLAFAQPAANVTPSLAEKLVPIIQRSYGQSVILILPDLPAWARRGFIERKLPFITIKRQMFLPQLGFDYRDRVLTRREPGSGPDIEAAVFTPSEQQVLLFMLLSKGLEFHTVQVRDSLSVSPMTVSRAFRTLEDRGLIDRPERGRKRPALLNQGKRAIWDAAQPFLQSPIKESVVLLIGELPFPVAGLSALAKGTNFAEPPYKTVATSSHRWRKWQTAQANWKRPDKTVPEAGDTIVQVWTYDPEPLTSAGQVDPLSLYLTLRDSTDDRIGIARNEILEAIQWQQ